VIPRAGLNTVLKRKISCPYIGNGTMIPR